MRLIPTETGGLRRRMFHAGHHLHGAGGHGLGDMALMFAVACAVSFSVLDAACRVRAAHGHARLLWLVGGSLTVGLGIWAMHFVALLSLQLPIPMTEDPVTLGVAAVTAGNAAPGRLDHLYPRVRGGPPRPPH